MSDNNSVTLPLKTSSSRSVLYSALRRYIVAQCEAHEKGTKRECPINHFQENALWDNIAEARHMLLAVYPTDTSVAGDLENVFDRYPSLKRHRDLEKEEAARTTPDPAPELRRVPRYIDIMQDSINQAIA